MERALLESRLLCVHKSISYFNATTFILNYDHQCGGATIYQYGDIYRSILLYGGMISVAKTALDDILYLVTGYAKAPYCGHLHTLY